MDSKVIFKKLNFSLIFVLFTAIFTNYISAQKIKVYFNSDRWDKNNAKVVEHLEREAIVGTAFLNDVELQNGIIEVDIATTERTRSYPGVLFRVKDQSNYERVYIRPHRSSFYDDAVQYAPMFNGIDSWQLYNGLGKTSSLDILPGKWNHLKIIVAEDQARIFWNDETEPALIIEHLEYGRSKGSLGISGPINGTAYYSNFSYEIIDDLTLPDMVQRESICGVIDKWTISDPYPYIGADFTKYPDDKILSCLKWQNVQANKDGVVDVSRYYSRKSRAADCIFAKTTISVESDTLLRVGFGYSDFITVYLNRKPVFLGVSSYQSRDKSFLGIVGYFDNIFLPLTKGKNELMVQVGEYMGGWAFCFRREDEIFTHHSLEKKWSQNDHIKLPESVVYNPNEGAFYVSNYFNEGNEYLSKLSLDGEILKAEWITGLKMPTGMCLYKNNLYVVDRTTLNIIDTKKDEIIEKIQLEGLKGPNDIAISGEGIVYISDMPGNSIFKYENGKLEKWLDSVDAPNALLFENNRLFIGVNGKVLLVNPSNKSVHTFVEFERSALIDGIQSDGNGDYLISDYNGKLYFVTSAGKRTLLLNTATPGIQTADFTYIPEKKIIIIPTFFNNSIVAYKLNN